MKSTKLVFLTCASLVLAGCSLVVQEQPPEPVKVGEGFWTVSVSKRVRPDDYPAIASDTCSEARKCMVGIWVGDARPDQLPFSLEQIAEQKFAFTRNLDTEFSVEVWDCQAFPQYAPGKCLPQTR